MNASREARLAAYAALLRKWNPSINLIAPGTVPDLERRHLQDSAQLASLVVDPWDGLWLDIGSGGGLPGLVVAIRPKFGGYLVAAWLAGIIVNLLTHSGYYDIALRDFGLMLGAVALGLLALRYDRAGSRA